MVEDEWNRDHDASELEDLLFVTYDAEKTSVKKLFAEIEDHGFEAKMR